MIVKGIQGLLILVAIYFTITLVKDYSKHKNNLEDSDRGKVIGFGFLTNFFDALGIGSYAPLAALLKSFNQVEDRLLPGTLNVSCTIPVIIEAIIFLAVIEVETLTLVSMLVSAALGAWVGAGVVSNLSEKKVQLVMGIALIASAFLMLAGKFDWMPSGGDAVGLKGGQLAFAVIGNFILGALMTAGIGLYAPCMALVYALGMSPRVAFPIMMGSCAFLMPVASLRFIKEGAYNRKASVGITLGGVPGVFIAAYIVKELPLNILEWLVIIVITYTAITFLRSALNNKIADAEA